MPAWRGGVTAWGKPAQTRVDSQPPSPTIVLKTESSKPRAEAQDCRRGQSARVISGDRVGELLSRTRGGRSSLWVQNHHVTLRVPSQERHPAPGEGRRMGRVSHRPRLDSGLQKLHGDLSSMYHPGRRKGPFLQS